MKNLEKQIIKRLNKVLNKYNLAIVSKINHNYKTTISVDDTFKKLRHKYVLVEIDNDITIIECYISWDNIEFVLLDSADEYSIFNLLDMAHINIKLYKDKGLEPYEIHLVLNKLYNELCSLNNCSSYEELIIKMDLMGI
jgi:hypothetical protein